MFMGGSKWRSCTALLWTASFLAVTGGLLRCARRDGWIASAFGLAMTGRGLAMTVGGGLALTVGY